MDVLKWMLLAPFRLLGAILVAIGYALAFMLGLGLVAGGTALTLTGGGAILGVPAGILGVLVLRELFEDDLRRRHPLREFAPAGVPPAEPYPAAAQAEPACQCGCRGTPRPASRHYRPRPQWAWIPGHWTVA